MGALPTHQILNKLADLFICKAPSFNPLAKLNLGGRGGGGVGEGENLRRIETNAIGAILNKNFNQEKVLTVPERRCIKASRRKADWPEHASL